MGWKMTFQDMDSVALGHVATHGSWNQRTQLCWCDLVCSVTLSHQSALDWWIWKSSNSHRWSAVHLQQAAATNVAKQTVLSFWGALLGGSLPIFLSCPPSFFGRPLSFFAPSSFFFTSQKGKPMKKIFAASTSLCFGNQIRSFLLHLFTCGHWVLFF